MRKTQSLQENAAFSIIDRPRSSQSPLKESSLLFLLSGEKCSREVKLPVPVREVSGQSNDSRLYCSEVRCALNVTAGWRSLCLCKDHRTGEPHSSFEQLQPFSFPMGLEFDTEISMNTF
jgi:hypothetical protein